jgi:hypothetical protein
MRSLTASAAVPLLLLLLVQPWQALLTIQPVHCTLPQDFVLSAGSYKDGYNNPLVSR